eukprot:761533-Hanusia_phi.AAC.2
MSTEQVRRSRSITALQSRAGGGGAGGSRSSRSRSRSRLLVKKIDEFGISSDQLQGGDVAQVGRSAQDHLG